MTRPPPDEPAPLFRLFWENSRLDARTAPAFAARIDEDDRAPARGAQLFYPGADVPLPTPSDPLAELMARRASGRAFGPAGLTTAQLGGLFHGFRETRGGRARAIASAGGRYPVEAYALLFRAEGALAGRVVYYDADAHALSVVGPCPAWRDVAAATALALEGEPAALFVFVVVPSRTLRRYGERGGRFVLMEVGHYAQSLALRIEHEGLRGVEAGGLQDEPARAWLGLAQTDAMVALGYAVGHPPPVRPEARP